MRRKALVAWSSGKDSAFALHEARRGSGLEILAEIHPEAFAFGHEGRAWNRPRTP
jgi:diphthamide synthase (EF-2-diphthine--ammonia ligase)